MSSLESGVETLPKLVKLCDSFIGRRHSAVSISIAEGSVLVEGDINPGYAHVRRHWLPQDKVDLVSVSILREGAEVTYVVLPDGKTDERRSFSFHRALKPSGLNGANSIASARNEGMLKDEDPALAPILHRLVTQIQERKKQLQEEMGM